MRYGIFSDVHANIDALRAVFEDAPDVRTWYFLGDAVGYGPFPVETIHLLQKKVPVTHWVLGNHDALLLNLITDDVNDGAADSLSLHRQLLEKADLLDWCRAQWTLKKMEAKRVRASKINAWLVHGSLPIVKPFDLLNLYIWPNLKNIDYGKEALKELSKLAKNGRTNLLFHGHTHFPYARGVDRTTQRLSFLPIHYDAHPIELDKFEHLLICPGSVGQPRNPDPEPHAAYGILDTTACTFQFCRVAYDTEPTRYEIDKLGYDRRKTMQSYLLGAFPGHKFWEENPYWSEWNKIYHLKNWGWEVNNEHFN